MHIMHSYDIRIHTLHNAQFVLNHISLLKFSLYFKATHFHFTYRIFYLNIKQPHIFQ